MHITHVNFTDTVGGAAVAARRIHQALLQSGVNSHMAVAHQYVTDQHTTRIWSKLHARIGQGLYNVLEKLPLRLYTRPAHPAYTHFSWLPTLRHKSINALPHDIVHLHWVSDGFLSPYALGHLRGPAVWTLHDTWAFTGGCHYPGSCHRYYQNCGQCAELQSTSPYDLSRLHWALKRRAVQTLNPVIVSPSKYYVAEAAKSGMFAGLRVEHIPYAIDTDMFSPIDKTMARTLLNLPHNVPLVVFCAITLHDPRKGADLLQEAITRLHTETNQNIACVLIGDAHADMQFNCPTHFLGRLTDAIALKLAYAAADVMVCPSREDNLPNTVLESLACGTPVAGFTIGGMPDMVTHQHNGYLAKPYDAAELAHGIAWILENPERYHTLAAQARNHALEHYSMVHIAKRYTDLYASLL